MCCIDYHCPFCSSAVFQSTKLSKVRTHLESHFNRAVLHEGYTIHRCGLHCRPQLHYHCIHCQSMLFRKSDFIKHLSLCKEDHSAITSTLPDQTTKTTSIPSLRTATTTFQDPTTTTTTIPSLSTTTTTIQDPTTTTTTIPSLSTTTTTIQDPTTTTTTIPSLSTTTTTIQDPTTTTTTIASLSTTTTTIQDPTTKNTTIPSLSTTTTTIQDPTTKNTTIPSLSTTTSPTLPITPSEQMRRVRVKAVLKKKCPICHLLMNKTNLKRHIESTQANRRTSQHLPTFRVNVLIWRMEFIQSTNHSMVPVYLSMSKIKYGGKINKFAVNPRSARKVRSTEEMEVLTSAGDENRHEEADLGDIPYPPKDEQKFKVMVQYILNNKKLPVVLPEHLRLPSVEKQYPRHLIPEEMMCQHCPGNVHTAVSRVVEYLERTSGVQFPSSDTVLQGYLHFEALTEHDYQYSCVNCGDHPPVVIMDLHKKGAFHLSVSDLSPPPEDFNGEVDMQIFWEALSVERIGRGFVTSQQKNPFTVPPSFHFWAPWIGPKTCRSNHALNTEYKKVRPPKPTEVSEITVTEDRLTEELYKQKVQVVRNLCKECGLDPSGSRADLLLRLSSEMKSRQTYDKVFQKIWAASGGWAVIMCPCGIVYSIKCQIRAESPRDFADMLLSWKHMPNVIIDDFARGLATHMNLREPERLPFNPFEGRLSPPTPDNIAKAKDGKLKFQESQCPSQHPSLRPQNRASKPPDQTSDRKQLS
ncbi:unnamed protein product [Leuciscus chuanchicus]